MPNVLVEEKDRTTIVTLNRPERRNALTIELMSELADALDKTSADPQKPYLIRPLIMSSGRDKDFDVVTDGTARGHCSSATRSTQALLPRFHG